MDIKTIPIDLPDGANVIIGQTHFIKSAEDLYEALVNSCPGIKFGLAFCEASGPCLVRYEGNDENLSRSAQQEALKIGCGHSFIIFLRGAFPINVLDRVKACPEVLTIFCATANPVKVLVVEEGSGRGLVGVIDGEKPKGIESETARKERYDFLRKIGYKL